MAKAKKKQREKQAVEELLDSYWRLCVQFFKQKPLNLDNHDARHAADKAMKVVRKARQLCHG